MPACRIAYQPLKTDPARPSSPAMTATIASAGATAFRNGIDTPDAPPRATPPAQPVTHAPPWPADALPEFAGTSAPGDAIRPA
jgi:hypothetical protein